MGSGSSVSQESSEINQIMVQPNPNFEVHSSPHWEAVMVVDGAYYWSHRQITVVEAVDEPQYGSTLNTGGNSSNSGTTIDIDFLRIMEVVRQLVRVQHLNTVFLHPHPDLFPKHVKRPEGFNSIKSFLSYLKAEGVDVINHYGYKELTVSLNSQETAKGWVPQGVDCAIAAQLVRYCHQPSITDVILYAGDSNFTHPISTLKRNPHGKRIWIVGIRDSIDESLLQFTEHGAVQLINLVDYLGDVRGIGRVRWEEQQLPSEEPPQPPVDLRSPHTPQQSLVKPPEAAGSPPLQQSAGDSLPAAPTLQSNDKNSNGSYFVSPDVSKAVVIPVNVTTGTIVADKSPSSSTKFYKAQLCKYLPYCPFGARCNFAHSEQELLGSPKLSHS